jgi:hypothetical protein
MSDFAPDRGHPNDAEAVRAHLRNSALTLTEEERVELLDELNRQIDEIDGRKSPGRADATSGC